MKIKLNTRLICLIISGVLLTGALSVAAINGSPYETLKNSIFNAMLYENFTLEGEMTLVVNGEVIENDTVRMIHTANGSVEFDQSGSIVSIEYDNLTLRRSYLAQDGTQWYSGRNSNANWNNSSFWPGATMTPDMRDTARFRFAELFVDILVGDLKNNMTMSTNDGIRRVSGTITHSQLPELVRLGIDMLIEQSRNWYRGDYGVKEDYRELIDMPIRSLTFDRISGDADIDAMGNLLYLNTDVKATVTTVFGDSYTMEFTMFLRFVDIGTSVVISPVPGALELLTPEFVEHISGWRYNTVYFTRTADGSIDANSVIDTWPGSLRHRTPASNIPEIDSLEIDVLLDTLFYVEMLIAEGDYEEALEILIEMATYLSDMEDRPGFVLDEVILSIMELQSLITLADF